MKDEVAYSLFEFESVLDWVLFPLVLALALMIIVALLIISTLHWLFYPFYWSYRKLFKKIAK